MLVLTRKAGDKVIIAGDIVVTVLSRNGGQVRLGIDAPPEVRIVRAELRERPEGAGPAAHSAGAEPLATS